MNENEQLFGFLNINKPIDITSHDVINVLRKVSKNKQIGHTGTLDPFAQGVLPICIGKATRLIEYLNDEKEYLATVNFGKNTDTYDIKGSITKTFDKKINIEELSSALKFFEGEIEQTPTIYSAIKIKGKKLYEYARKGENIEIPKRKVFIEKIELKKFDEKLQKAEILIKCSKGTYIRSIAFDLGKDLKCGAFLSKLIRTQAGKFFIGKSIKLEDIKSIEDISKNLINPLEMLDLKTYELDENEHKKIQMGQFLNCEIKDIDNIILLYNKKISAIEYIEDKKIKVKKVFL